MDHRNRGPYDGRMQRLNIRRSRVCWWALCAAATTGLLLCEPGIGGAAAKPPHIVLLFADDLGWSDLGFRNPDVFESPHIDQLARDGLSFEQAYIASPTCSPSRGTLLTGLHPARLRLVRHIPGGKQFPEFDAFGRTEAPTNLWPTDPAQFPCVNWLDLDYTTYAEALKKLGYYNLFVGKWHLGHEPYHPVHQGFDRQFGTTNFGHPRSYHPPFFRNTDVLADVEDRYLTEVLTDEAVRFIEDYDRERPFLISLWYYGVHGPHQGRPDYVRHSEAKGLTGRYAHYAAMVKALDESVGRIRQALTRASLAENTLVLFLSDQGGYFENPPFHGGKREDTLYEGGARVPFLVYWPGVTKPGSVNRSVVQSTDLFPTLVEIAGGNPSAYSPLDGVSLASVIRTNAALERALPIYGYRAYEDLYASVRDGDWKLLAYRSGRLKLYNLAEDIAEKRDLAREHPDRVAAMKADLAAWERSMGVAAFSGIQESDVQ